MTINTESITIYTIFETMRALFYSFMSNNVAIQNTVGLEVNFTYYNK